MMNKFVCLMTITVLSLGVGTGLCMDSRPESDVFKNARSYFKTMMDTIDSLRHANGELEKKVADLRVESERVNCEKDSTIEEFRRKSSEYEEKLRCLLEQNALSEGLGEKYDQLRADYDRIKKEYDSLREYVDAFLQYTEDPILKFLNQIERQAKEE